MQLPVLKNRYYVMRHGQSLANTAGLIVSHPENGLTGYGLSSKGRRQVEAGINASALTAKTRIFSSDFKRAKETAEIAHRLLHSPYPVEFDTRLRERNFGELELGSDTRYKEVWIADQSNPGHSEYGVENLQSVIGRSVDLMLECEEKLSDETCLLVSHGDILQILQTAFSGIHPSCHRELPHLETAGIRELVRK